MHALRTGNIWTTYDKGSLLLGTCWFSHSISPSIELPAVNSMGLPCALIFSIGALVNIRVSITILVKEFGPPGLAPRYCYRECGTKGLARRVLYQDVGTTMMQLKHQYGYFCTQIIGLTLLCQVLNTKSLVTRMYISLCVHWFAFVRYSFCTFWSLRGDGRQCENTKNNGSAENIVYHLGNDAVYKPKHSACQCVWQGCSFEMWSAKSKMAQLLSMNQLSW